jgi:CRISPR/Cas system CSM-associated protein Csm3 (group 7 of RAMP superfamily)
METEKINYTITFLSDWHVGSGLGSGADADSVVIKDSANLPYLPGKTIKGLLKDALLDIQEVQSAMIPKDFIDKNFGCEIKEEGIKVTKTEPGTLFFSNAELAKEEKEEAIGDLSRYLYRNMASTTINESGVAKDGSLRTIEVCIPLTIEGYIEGVEKDAIPVLEKAFKMLRHLGSNRNRGLGRCIINIKK